MSCLRFTAERLADFQIGTTFNNPSVTAPVLGAYSVCASQGDALGAGKTKDFACDSTGRYVIVQLKGANFLTLCEVEVYGGMNSEKVQYTQTK